MTENVPTHGVLLRHESWTAWCRRCDASASPARRDTAGEAEADLQAHTNIVHAEEAS